MQTGCVGLSRYDGAHHVNVGLYHDDDDLNAQGDDVKICMHVHVESGYHVNVQDDVRDGHDHGYGIHDAHVHLLADFCA